MAELRLAGEKSRTLPLEDLPQALRSPIKTWIDACTNGGSDKAYGIDAAIDLVRFMQAAYRSADQNGARVALDSV